MLSLWSNLLELEEFVDPTHCGVLSTSPNFTSSIRAGGLVLLITMQCSRSIQPGMYHYLIPSREGRSLYVFCVLLFLKHKSLHRRMHHYPLSITVSVSP